MFLTLFADKCSSMSEASCLEGNCTFLEESALLAYIIILYTTVVVYIYHVDNEIDSIT